MTDKTSEKAGPYTLPEAADYLGLSKGFLYKLTSKGQISHFKPNGGRVYFLKQDLDAYLYRGRRDADFQVHQRAENFLNGGDR